jgi:hypothetical protein
MKIKGRNEKKRITKRVLSITLIMLLGASIITSIQAFS